MSEIQRYSPATFRDELGYPLPSDMVRRPSGDYVLHADHLSALASKDEKIRVLRDALECWPLKRLISYARDNGESMMALLFEEVRDAALSTAPEGEKP